MRRGGSSRRGGEGVNQQHHSSLSLYNHNQQNPLLSQPNNNPIQFQPINPSTQSGPSTSKPGPTGRNSNRDNRNLVKTRFVKVGFVKEGENLGNMELGSSGFVERDDLCGNIEETGDGFLLNEKIDEKKLIGSSEFVERDHVCGNKEETGDGFLSNELIGEKIEENFDDTIESRLVELQLSVEGPELSEEVLRINDQLQEDELGIVEDGENRGNKELGSSNFVERDDLCGDKEETGDGSFSNELIGEKILIGEKNEENFEDNDIESRLVELDLSVEGPDLSEEVSRINDQLQEDELLAMESIYGENVFILDKQRGLRSFQIHIHLEAPEEFKISAKFSSPGDRQAKATNSPDELLYSFQIQYLPPIILTCLLPKSYPSHLQPNFTISVQWLNSEKISKMCSMLDSIWVEQTGQEVIYHWVDWLLNSSLSYLGFDNEIVLGPYGLRNDRDTRAISGSVSPDVDIPLLKSYNDEQRHESFCKNFQECCICYSEYPGSDFIRLPCQHFFCLKCMKTYSNMHVKEGTLSQLLCPQTKCGGMVPPGLLKRLLGDDDFERWESLMLQKTLDSMSDVIYCPRCEMACIEDEDNHAQCAKCFFSFCTLCRERRHVGVTCMTPEMKLKMLQERQNSSQVKSEHKRREKEMINELLSVTEILRDAKQCPSCKMAISKIEGCNKMVCNNCGNFFCYRCNCAIDGYDHFRSGECELFPQEEIQRWEARNPRQVAREIQAVLFAEHAHTCPLCRQFNIKLGNNNHIFCWACQNHYCYLCRKLVKRAAQHFSPKGCRQHTEG